MSHARTIKYCLSSSSLTTHARTLFLVHARHPARTPPPRTHALPRACNLTTHAHHSHPSSRPQNHSCSRVGPSTRDCGTFLLVFPLH